jgi:hypothetical protein
VARRFRPAYLAGDSTLHHIVEVAADDQPKWEDGHVARALCGADIHFVDAARPLWKAGGEPCRHCTKVFRQIPR